MTLYSTPHYRLRLGSAALERRSRSVAAARDRGRPATPSGRPIVSAALHAGIASARTASRRSAKRPLRSSSGATLTSPASGLRDARSPSTTARPQPVRRAAPGPDSARQSALPPTGVLFLLWSQVQV